MPDLPRLVALLSACLLLPSCKVYDPLYCDVDRPCEDPERPFCDLNGEYPASEGIKKTCIPEPEMQPGTFTIALVDDEVEVRVGEELAVQVIVAREGSPTGEIALRADGLPAGASAEPVTVAESADEATLVIRGGAAEPGAVATVTVTASSTETERTADLQLLVLGQPGTIDPSFGILGVAAETVPATDDARFVAQLANGALLVGGQANVNRPGTAGFVRFSPVGQLDTEFGDEGWLEFDLAGVSPQSVVAFAQQAGDRVVLASSDRDGGGELALGRVDGDGRIDTSFAGGGAFTRRVSSSLLTASSMGLGPTQEIVVTMTNGTERDGILMVRFTADGVYDPGFGDGGIVRLDRGDNHTVGRLHVLSDGSIIAVGSATDSKGIRTPFLFRVTAQGALDSSFGAGGVVAFEAGAFPSTVAELEDGRLIVAGSRQEDGAKPAFWRLSRNGELDRSFGIDGELRVAMPEGRSGGVRDLFPVENGKFLGVGSPGVVLVKLDPQSGTLDDSYGVKTLDLNAERGVVSFIDVGRRRLVVLADLDSLRFVLARVFM
jgi:uncharacterized delta-60 repeat protein